MPYPTETLQPCYQSRLVVLLSSSVRLWKLVSGTQFRGMWPSEGARNRHNQTASTAECRGVRVVGRLKQDRWTSPEGQTRSKVSIVAEHVEFKPQFNKDKPAEGEEKEAEAQVEDTEEETAKAWSF